MPKVKVTPELAQDIKAAHANGLIAREIAAQFGLHIRTVWRTIAGENCKPKEPLADRFWKRVRRGRGNACHEWLGGKNARGYGVLAIWKSTYTDNILAHRLAYELKHGEIPAGLEVIHSCDNAGCVNHRHLRVGTHKENMRDMLTRKRHAFGSVDGRKGQSALTAAKVVVIRKRYAKGESQMRLAIEYGVSGPTIFYAVTGKRWKDAGGPITPKGAYRPQADRWKRSGGQ